MFQFGIQISLHASSRRQCSEQTGRPAFSQRSGRAADSVILPEYTTYGETTMQRVRTPAHATHFVRAHEDRILLWLLMLRMYQEFISVVLIAALAQAQPIRKEE
jgi:hypothetical protein